MDFEQELQDLISAALEAGVPRDMIITELGQFVLFLTGQEDEEAKDKEGDGDG